MVIVRAEPLLTGTPAAGTPAAAPCRRHPRPHHKKVFMKPYVATSPTQVRTLLKVKDTDLGELALVDLDLDLEDGVALITAALSRCRTITAWAVTAVDSPDQTLTAIRTEAHEYLLRIIVPQGPTSAVAQACEGGPPITHAITPAIARQLSFNRRAAEGETPKIHVIPPLRSGSLLQERLSKREQEVCRLIARGHSNKETGAMLKISPATIDTHIRGIYKKLNINSRAALRRLFY